MKMRQRFLGESAQPDEYGWIESILRERDPAAYRREEDDENMGILMGNDLLRTVFFTLLLGGLACLLFYFIQRVAVGEGRRVFLVMVTLAALLACGAAVPRSGIWLRFVLVLGSLCAFALLVDQFAYYRWHKRVDRLVTTLQRSIESDSPIPAVPTNPRPTSFWIDPDREILLKFEPPLLAWTYHLNSASPLAQTLVTGWYRCLSRVTRGRDLDSVVRTIVRPHEVYAVRVKSDERVPVCQGDETRHWTMSIETWRGDRTLRLDDRVGDYLP
ncbi:MAG: hypothetical protein DMF52_00770 [Acidobacteria bacterium]|nr:MAG: hypothetical protein DMF52_00770 [Acidobacteriota bacterium]